MLMHFVFFFLQVIYISVRESFVSIRFSQPSNDYSSKLDPHYTYYLRLLRIFSGPRVSIPLLFRTIHRVQRKCVYSGE